MAQIIRGTNGNDRFVQGSLTNLDIRTLGGNDTINLNRSDDLGGDNRVDAGKGNDTVTNAFEGGNIILLGKGNDVYFGTGFSSLGGLDGVDGGAGNDQFVLQTFKSAYHGGKGNDAFFSDGWQNNINGGEGTDTISYQLRHENNVIGGEGVVIDLAAGAAQTGASRFETLTSIENAVGSERADRIGGTDGENFLAGLGGNDELHGFGGDDIIDGGAGADFISGGAGADSFIYRTANDASAVVNLNPFAVETIADFNGAEGDRIDLSFMDGSDGFTFNGAAAFTGSGHGEIRFENGTVQIDSDGNGRVDMLISMNGVSSMSNTDFLV
jgi:Ca2+-binding RTX toxin-like protein